MNPPKSNVLRLLEGDRGHRTKEQKAKNYFPIPLHHPTCPKDLSGEARKYWKKKVKPYRITEGDIGGFRDLCEWVAEIEFLKAEIKKIGGDHDGRTFKRVTVDGAGIEHQEDKTHPLVSQLNYAKKEKRILEKEFSIRYIVAVQKEEDDQGGNIR
jgi:phage terminase small subunit